MYTGREWISELNLYDYRNRFYLPLIGRFLQVDPKGFDAGDMNLFRYCGDDPVDHTDPMGLYRIEPGFTPEQKKELETAQPIAANKLEKGADAIEYGIAAGKNSEPYKAVKRDFEGVFHKPITEADMAKYAKDARNMVTALRDDGRLGYRIFPRNQEYFAKNGLPHHAAAAAPPTALGPGKIIWVNIDVAFKQNIYSLDWILGHEAAHNQGISRDFLKRPDSWDYDHLNSRQALDDADSYFDFVDRR